MSYEYYLDILKLGKLFFLNEQQVEFYFIIGLPTHEAPHRKPKFKC